MRAEKRFCNFESWLEADTAQNVRVNSPWKRATGHKYQFVPEFLI